MTGPSREGRFEPLVGGSALAAERGGMLWQTVRSLTDMHGVRKGEKRDRVEEE